MFAEAWAYGIAGALAALFLSRPLIRSAPDSMRVPNHEGSPVPVVGGVVIAAAALLASAAGALFDATGLPVQRLAPEGFMGRGAEAALLTVIGFFALGLVDDLAGAGQAKGFSGHLAALRRGEVTGGMVKAAGGGLLAIFVAASISEGFVRISVQAAVIALTANLFNLLDLRPGRAGKWYLLAGGAALAGVATLPSAPASAGYLQMAGAVTGAVVGWLPKDLRAEGMLGDAGSNLLGAVVGLGAVISIGDRGLWVLLAILVALTVLSERFSFTAMIEKFPPLRWFDRLGRADPKG